MRLRQVDEIHTPELFFLGRIVDEGLETERIVYDVEAEDTTEDVADDRLGSLKKRIYNGTAEFVLYEDHYEILWNDDMVVQSDIVGRVYHNDEWHSYTFNFAGATKTSVDNKTFRFVRTADLLGVNAVFGIEFSFGKGASSQIFYLDFPGKPVQIAWRIEAMLDKLQENRDDERGLTFGAGDDDAVLTEPVHDDPDNWGYFVYTYGGVDGYTCDDPDSRTPLERYQQGAGLKV